MKKLLIIISLILMLGTTAYAAELKDIKDTDYEKEILVLQALGIVDGDENAEFHPDDTVKRSEAAKLIVEAFSYDNFTCEQCHTDFVDVPESHWASGYIQAAFESAYVTGVSETMFAPDENITLEQACTIVLRAMGYELFAAREGGYPSGYMKYAFGYDLCDKVQIPATSAVTRGQLAYVLAKAMETPVVDFAFSNGGERPFVSIMNGRGADYLCPMIEFHKAYYVSGKITGTAISGAQVRKGYAQLDINYARRLGYEYINTSKVITCKTTDNIYDLLYLKGEFILKEIDEDLYEIIMIII